MEHLGNMLGAARPTRILPSKTVIEIQLWDMIFEPSAYIVHGYFPESNATWPKYKKATAKCLNGKYENHILSSITEDELYEGFKMGWITPGRIRRDEYI